MKRKVSARTYELLVDEMQDALYDYVSLGAPIYEPDVRKFAAETVDMLVDLVYTGEMIDQHKEEAKL
jgi:hypothetical protein